jgi:hypothetical protein
MQSAWNESDAGAAVAAYENLGRDLALRVYTTRLLGGDPRLVLHGGGNTSVKTHVTDLNGDAADVLCVKGSGWDMGSIEPAGLPAVRLAPLIKLRSREKLSDEEMVRLQRANLIDPAAPNPSVEALLAEAVGRFDPLPESDLFDVKYWSLEQAKLGGAKEPPLAGQVAVITGAAGAIGFATAKAFAAAGAELALLDIDEAAAQAKARAIGGAAIGVRCDVTDAAPVREAFARVVSAFGGWTPWCRMPAPPRRAGSARSTRRCCGRVLS